MAHRIFGRVDPVRFGRDLLDERAHVILTTSGFGHGTYPVFALVDEKGAPAGFEVEFLQVERPYKF